MKKRELKNDITFHDDITQRNIGLMTRLKQTQLFGSTIVEFMQNKQKKAT